MLIQVLYRNHRFDFIKTSRLDEFIENGQVSAFKRSKGWVRVGMDPIRAMRYDPSYQGKERRHYRGKKTAVADGDMLPAFDIG
jgi:hypothetical protein